MAPVMSMLNGTWADIRPGKNINSPGRYNTGNTVNMDNAGISTDRR
jgi:hypothetical protein